MSQATLTIPEKMYKKLQRFAEKTGKTTNLYIIEAIENHIEDLEDAYLAEQALERLAKGKDKVISYEEFWAQVENWPRS